MAGRREERNSLCDPVTKKKYPAARGSIRSRSYRRLSTRKTGPPVNHQALGLPSGTLIPQNPCRGRTTLRSRRSRKGEEDEEEEEDKEDQSLIQLCRINSPPPGDFTSEIPGYKGPITDPVDINEVGTVGTPPVSTRLEIKPLPINMPPSIPQGCIKFTDSLQTHEE